MIIISSELFGHRHIHNLALQIKVIRNLCWNSLSLRKTIVIYRITQNKGIVRVMIFEITKKSRVSYPVKNLVTINIQSILMIQRYYNYTWS